MKLTDTQVQQMRHDGFLRVPSLIGADDVQALRECYDRFLRREISCGDDDRFLGGLTRQVLWPSKYDPLFRDNAALQAAREIARAILGTPEPRLDFNMLISKEPGNLNETPWHQDFAYYQMPFTPTGTPIPNNSLQFWIALDDVDTENGCMQFVRGSHEGASRPHYVASGDPADEGRLLATEGVDPAQAIPCPLSAGGCTVHYEGTLHFTGGNRTADRPRRAYIVNFR